MLSAEANAKLDAIVNAETDNFVELMNIAGLDPTTAWRYADMSGVELDDADVSKWDFSGAHLAGADLSRVKNIREAIFNKDTEFEGCKLPDGVTPQSLVA